jgi:Ferredoxin-like domain in Api92-like protein
MPNWCHNTLDVTGDPEDVAAYAEHVRGGEGPLTFTADVPEPTGGEYLLGAWYAWRLENWGTKWDASFAGPTGGVYFSYDADPAADADVTAEALGVQRAEGAAVYKFDTAWSPPVAWLDRTAGKHPDLTFVLRFGEPGNGFAGQVTIGPEGREEKELAVEDVLAPEEMWF